VGTPYRLRTPDFICTVGSGTTCDQLRVDQTRGGWVVRVYRRHVDCVLPA
jgi:hypothetical protein